MTREERKAVSALKKGLPKIVKPLIKPYGFRMTSGRVWVRKDDMLYVMIPLINIKDTAILHTTFLTKPVFADDYLWDILGMEENKSEPFSLRVTGAFAAHPVSFHVSNHPLSALDAGELEAGLREDLEYLSAHIASVSPDGLSWFREMEARQERYWQSDVMRLILLLHDGNRDEAAAYLEQHSMRDFIINGKSFGELMEEYCRRV